MALHAPHRSLRHMRSSADIGFSPAVPVAEGASIQHENDSAAVRKPRGRIRRKLRFAGLALTTLIPFRALKRFAFKYGFGYQVEKSAHIGLVFLDCERL